MCPVAQGCEETHNNQQTMSADIGKQQQGDRGSSSDRYTSSINDDSARKKELEDEIAKTNFDPNFNATYWRIDDIKLVVNKRLTKQYLHAREDLQRQGLNENELQEVLLFSTEKDRRVGEICRDGARVGHKRRHVLGHTGSGIHLVRHFDILARYMAYQQCFSPATIVVYKCVLGRQKPIYPRLQKDDNHLPPHVLFDSHVSSRLVEPSMHIEEALNCSYVYVYQLDGASGCPRKFPRQVLPYAILTVYKKHPVMITDTMLAVDHSDITCRWEVKGETRSGYRFNFVKLKRKKRKQSTQSPFLTIGKLKGQLLEMRTKDHSNGKSFPTLPKASDVVESGLPGCIVRLERLKPSDIEKFVRMETPITHSENKTDTDSPLLRVDSSKQFDDNVKQTEASLSKECSNVCNVTEAQLTLKETDTDKTQCHESTTEKLAEQRQEKSAMQNSIPQTVSPSLGEAAPGTLDILPIIQEAENMDVQLGETSKGAHQISDRESEVSKTQTHEKIVDGVTLEAEPMLLDRESEVSKTQTHEKAVDGVTLEAEPMISKEIQRQSGYKTDGTSDIDDKENTYSDHFTERCMAERLPLHSVFNHCDLDVHRTCSALDKENQMNDDNQIPKQIDISTALKVRNFLSAKYKSVCIANTPNENAAQSDKSLSDDNDKKSDSCIVGSALSRRKVEVNKNKVVGQENVQLFENLTGLNVTSRDDSDAETIVGGLNDVDELLNLEEKSYQTLQQTYMSQNQNVYEHNSNSGIVQTQIKHEQNDTVQDPLVHSNCFEEDTNRQENIQNDSNIECDKTNECRKLLASDAVFYTIRGVKSEPDVEYQRPHSFRIDNELVFDLENVKPTNSSLPHQQKNKNSISEEQLVCSPNEAITTTPFQRLDINVKIEHIETDDCHKVTSENHDKHPNEQEEACLPVNSSSIFSHFRRSLASTNPAITMKILQSEIANVFTFMKSKQTEIGSKEENFKQRHKSGFDHFSSEASKGSEKMHTVMRKRKLSRDNVEDSPKRLLVATICKQDFHESHDLSANNANCTQTNTYRDKHDQQVFNDKKDVEITDERQMGVSLIQENMKVGDALHAESIENPPFDKSQHISTSVAHCTLSEARRDKTHQQLSKNEEDTKDERTLAHTLLVPQNIMTERGNVNAGTAVCQFFDKSSDASASNAHGAVSVSYSDETDQQDKIELSVPKDIMKGRDNVNAETAVCQYFNESRDASASNAHGTVFGSYSDETDQQVSKDEVDTGTIGEQKLNKRIGNNLSVPKDSMTDSGNVNAETAVSQYFDKSRDASANNAHGAVSGSYSDETDQQDEIELSVPKDIMIDSDNVNAESEQNQSSDNSNLSANNFSFPLSNSYSEETDKINSQNREDAVTIAERTLGSKLLLPQDFMKGSDSLYAEPTVNQTCYEPRDSNANSGTVSVDDRSHHVYEKGSDKIHAGQTVYKAPVYLSTSISQLNIHNKPSELPFLKGNDTFQRSDLTNKCGEVAMPLNSIFGSSLSSLPRDTMKGSDTLQAETIYDSTPGSQNTSISILPRIDTKPSEKAHLETNGAQQVSCVVNNCVEGGLSPISTCASVENGNFVFETLVRAESSNQQSHLLEAASSPSANIQPLTTESSTRVHNTSDSETGQKISVICCNRNPTSNNLPLSGRPLLDFRCSMKKKGKKKRRKAHDRMSDNIRQRNGLGFGMRNSKGFNGIHMRRVNGYNDRPRFTHREFQNLKMRYEIRNRIRNAFSEYQTFDSMRGKEAAILLSELARSLVSNYDDIVREDSVRQKEPENVRRHKHVQRAMTDSYGSRNETNVGARRSFTEREHQRRHPRSESRTGKLLSSNEHTKTFHFDKRRRFFDEKYRNLVDNRKPAFDNERRCSKHSSNESRHSRHRERYDKTRPAEDVLFPARMHISTQRQKKVRSKSPEKIHHYAKEKGCPRREEESAKRSSNETFKRNRSSRVCSESRSKSPEKIHHSTKVRDCSSGQEESARGSAVVTLKKKQSRLDPKSRSKSPEKIQHSSKAMDCPPREKSAKESGFKTLKKKQSRLCPESRSKSPKKIQHSPKEMDCPPREKSAKESVFETLKKKQSRLCLESRSKTSEKNRRSPKERDCPPKEEESARRLVTETLEKKRHMMSPKSRSKSPENLHHSAKGEGCSRREEKSANGSVIKIFEKKSPTLCPKSRRNHSHSDEDLESDKEQTSPSDKSTRYKKCDIEEMRPSHTESFVNKYTDPKSRKPCTVGLSRSRLKDSDTGNNTSDTDDCDINRSRRLKRRVEVANDLLSLKRHKSPDAELSSGNSRVFGPESQDLKYDVTSSRRPGSNNEHECRKSGKVRRLDDLREHIDVRRHEGLRKGIVTLRDEERQRDVEVYDYDKDTLRISVEFGRSVEMCRDTDLLSDVGLQRDTKVRRDVDLRREAETRREFKLYNNMKERRDVKTCQEVFKSKPTEVYKESYVFGKDSKDRHNAGANRKNDANDRTNSSASKTAETGKPIPVISLRSAVQVPYPLAY